MNVSDQESWLRVKQRLRAAVGEEVFKSWFASMELASIEGDLVRLSVPTKFLKSWVQSHYVEKLLACWKAELSAVCRIDLVHRSAVLRNTAAKAKPAEPAETTREVRNTVTERNDARITPLPAQAAHEALGGSPLDPRLSFETFVVGRSNTLAHAAAKQVALARRGEPVMFNPLYVHAGVGLGKTHLLQAIAWAGNGIPDRKVLYLTAEKFMYGFVAALKAQTALAFKEALRGIDVLVIDDLQWCESNIGKAPHLGWLREVYSRLALLERSDRKYPLSPGPFSERGSRLDGAVPTAKNAAGNSSALARRSRVWGAGRASPFSNWLMAADVTPACDATAARVRLRDSRASRSRRAEKSTLAFVAASSAPASAKAGRPSPASDGMAGWGLEKALKSVISTQIKHRRSAADLPGAQHDSKLSDCNCRPADDRRPTRSPRLLARVGVGGSSVG